MRLPEELEAALTESVKAGRDLPRAAAELSARYRRMEFDAPALKSQEDRLAYVLARMPATYAAAYKALELTLKSTPATTVKSVLDLGAGPGTACWAASEVFPSLDSVTLVERDLAMARLGADLMLASSNRSLKEAKWVAADLTQEIPTKEADLVTISYALGELKASGAERLVAQAWAAARQLLVIVEPGTKAGFATIAKFRDSMIQAGAEVAAPCPHHGACPMAVAGDWCHFAQRLERSSIHRRIKGAELGYEDEKFSFIAFSKVGASRAATRVLRHPLYRPKQVQLTLCTDDGMKRTVVTKSQGERYRAAKKLDWGDGWDR